MPQIEASGPTIRIVPWADPVIDTLGHDPRSGYVETYWLGILGPSATWLMRRLAACLDSQPEGFELDLQDMAGRLGLGHRGGRNSPFMRSVARCIDFDLAHPRGDGVVAVRRHMPPLSRRQVVRLPPSLQDSHRRWQESQVHHPCGTELQRRVLDIAARSSEA